MPEIRIELPAETLESILIATERERIDRLLLEGFDSGERITVDREYWERRKAELIERHGLGQHA